MTKATTPAAAPVAEPTATPTTPATPATELSAEASRAQFALELKRYTDKFGAADGATYFQAGMSYEAALEKALEKATETTKAAEASKLSAEQRLAAINLGESKPVESGGKPGGDDKTSFSSCFKAATSKANAAA